MRQATCFPAIDGQLGWYETSKLTQKMQLGRKHLPTTYDVAVVGAGFTGLAAASRLIELDPNLKIAVIDALKVGQGTSGRNAGFIIDLPHNLDSNSIDVARDKYIQALNCYSIDRLKRLSEPYSSEVLWHKAGKYLVAHETKHFSNLDTFTATLDAIEAPYEVLEGSALAAKLGTDYYKKGIYTQENILMNPSALTQSVALSMQDNVDWYEDSPVKSISKKETWQLQMPQNTIHAKKVIMAVNSFTEEFKDIKNRLAPVFTYASLTRPLSSTELEQFSGVEPWGLTSAHPAGTTVRLTSDNRIFIRNTFKFRRKLTSGDKDINYAKQKHLSSYNNRFPKLKGIPFEFSWGGMLCMTMNHQPVFVESDNDLYTISGCNGVGVAKGTYLGAYMAENVLGQQSKELDFIKANASPSWVVPEPLRSIGASIRFAYEEFNAKGEV